MPVEIRTSDGRHWARPALQNHAPAPLVRLVTPHERYRRQLKFVAALLLFSGLLMSLAALLKGI
jgi:hypothetical protein